MYKINSPPSHRPIRISADGTRVFSLPLCSHSPLGATGRVRRLQESMICFTMGAALPSDFPSRTSERIYSHALQLRQAKLAFASRQEGPDRVYVLAGVHSDEVCAAYKNETVMTHQERYVLVCTMTGSFHVRIDAAGFADVKRFCIVGGWTKSCRMHRGL